MYYLTEVARMIIGADMAAIILWMLKPTVLMLVGLGLTRCVNNRAASLKHFILRLTVVMVLLLSALIPLGSIWTVEWPAAVGGVLQIAGISVAGDSMESTSEFGLLALSPASWVGLVWLFGCAVVAARLLLGVVILQVRLVRARTCKDKRITAAASGITRQLGLKQLPRIVMSDRTAIPMVWGIRRPVLMLPHSAREWTDNRLRVILTHELAHIRRSDVLYGLLAGLLTGVHWFNPLAWQLKRQMQREAEFACDDIVLSQGADQADYAHQLVEYARGVGKGLQPIVTGIAPGYNVQLEARIMSILTNRKRGGQLRRSIVAAVTGIGLALVLPLATVSLSGCSMFQGGSSAYPEPDEFVRADTMPVMTHTEKPVYPESAKESGTEGEVWVAALVDTQGDVREARIHESSGVPELDAAAIDAAYKHKFRPAIRDGEPIAVWIRYSVNFALTDK